MPFESEFQEHHDEGSRDKRPGKVDRKLGDEWAGWDGTLEGKIEEPKGRFILLATLVWLLFGSLLLLCGYLFEPRLDQWPPAAQWTVKFLFIVLFAGGFLMYGLILVEVLTERATVLPYRWSEGMLLWLLPKAIWVGSKVGLSRDRVGNSFVKVNNALTRAYDRKIDRSKLLILLPRCLNKSTRQEIRRLVEGQPYSTLTVGGGEEARKVIHHERPTLIIALACERDLLSGIRDVATFIPVIAIPNKRPEGPCKNTYIDMDEFRRALRFFESAGQSEGTGVTTRG